MAKTQRAPFRPLCRRDRRLQPEQVLTLLGDLSGEIAILFGVCWVVVLKDDPMTPLSEMVIVFGGVPGADCEKTLPINNEDTISSSYPCSPELVQQSFPCHLCNFCLVLRVYDLTGRTLAFLKLDLGTKKKRIAIITNKKTVCSGLKKKSQNAH